ncbi:methylenetetrahydrofolate reductase C-terminal domain-containing protein [Acinetobacter gyllenbergii]|uniref:methylenetetrahydrofolate reductase C-terminal domain-containing protein n=1 Tax=Acinetobacter gyllenbergii TaxID=134534 RepID=UPI000B307B70|nr:methylenetetrahydrofolate reductase C-terminal domain-containing protein [Acinetobacter gyllenbergii]
MSLFSQCLDQKKFCILVEYICSTKNTFAVTQDIAGFPAMMTLADRVHSDEDPEPINIAKLYPQSIEKILHFSGKGRDIADFEKFLDQAELSGERNLLLLTGDKLKNHNFGLDIPTHRTRYLESVGAVMAAKQRNGFNIGVAFNPFKYTEAESDAQYLKLHKKIKAGADFLITQLGFDLDKIRQTQKRLAEEYPHFPLIVCVMPLTLRRAKFMHSQRVAGIVIPKHLIHVLEQEYQADPILAEKNVYARCALQILICQHLGYAGIHLSACHKQDEQQKLVQALKQYQTLSLRQCEVAWNTLWQAEIESLFKPEVKVFVQKVSIAQLLKYKTMHWMHSMLFDSRPAMGMGRFVFRASFWNRPKANHLLLKVEHLSKHSIVGCESCGQCRLGETLYLCPETCPKGLANGPCGGTTLDRCEFGDRECIHSIKARLAKAVKQTELLKTELIPTVAIKTRQSSSWKNWYLAKEA